MLRKTVLRKKTDFDAIYKTGKSVGDRYVVVFAKPNGLGYRRTAFLASKKVGGSVERNRARRLMKESYRSLSENCKDNFDLIMIARAAINGKKCGEVEASLRSALKRAGALKTK
ncbi:MAG: ribonuclease P protein component [Eubacterium sp.]|jgi:ribonuclease P protein component